MIFNINSTRGHTGSLLVVTIGRDCMDRHLLADVNEETFWQIINDVIGPIIFSIDLHFPVLPVIMPSNVALHDQELAQS